MIYSYSSPSPVEVLGQGRISSIQKGVAETEFYENNTKF